MKIIVDAFGGDHAPLEVLKGCAMAKEEVSANTAISALIFIFYPVLVINLFTLV